MNTPETPATNLKTFYIVDFDRTLADSEKLFDMFVTMAQRYTALPEAQITAAHEQMIAKGDSFDTASYVRDHMREAGEGDRWNDLEKHYIHESRSVNMLLPGARDLLDEFRIRGERFGILTYGNPFWQHLKLSAVGFNHLHRIVMVQKQKGKLVSSWQQSDGSFHLPQEFGGGTVDRIVMLDDKAVSFDGFPGNPSAGYHVVDKAHLLPSQEGDVPSNVIHCTTLAQAQALLFS